MRNLLLAAFLLWTLPVFAQDRSDVRRFQGTYDGDNQPIIAAPGAGKRICIRSFIVTTEGSGTSWQFNSRTGSTNTALTPNVDLAANSGAVAGPDESCWAIALENQAWVITTNNPVDLFGTYKIVPK